jgi:MFS family permease
MVPIIFALAAVPGYVLAFLHIDQIGHKKLQWMGFLFMGAAFGAISLIPGVTHPAVPFLLLFGMSYFFAEFGPNTTTFVLAAEVFPTSIRTTAHGISAGIAKFGAFTGVFAFPLLIRALSLRGTLFITFLFCVAGLLLTLILPEPTRKSLEELTDDSTDKKVTKMA